MADNEIESVAGVPPEPEQHTQVIPEDADDVQVYVDQTPELLDEDEEVKE